MAQLTGKTEEKITEELVGVIFKNPLTDQWESGDEYLSGNVRDKLNTARTFAENHPEFTAFSPFQCFTLIRSYLLSMI